MRNFLISALIFANIGLNAQKTNKVVLDTNDTLTGYYLETPPLGEKIESAILLLPGFSQAPESIYTESMIPYVAAANNILTISVAGGHTIFANEKGRDNLNKVIAHVKEKYPQLLNKWVLGGFSAGGSIALRFAEYCNESEGNCPVTFEGVFSVDSPVDLIDLWDYFEREIKKNASEAGASEAKYISGLMEEQEGNPTQNKTNYEYLTPFNKSMNEPGNENYLQNTAVRVYHDVDIPWQLQNRRRSVWDSNYLYSSEMINRLLLLGNEEAEFIQGETGYRSNGMRHPHSWSIVDEVELIQWVKSL